MKIRAAVVAATGATAPFAASRPVAVHEVELDPPGDGELLVRIRAAGLCHSDLSVINGNRPRAMPIALGHEASAEVVECGPGVHDLAPGDHVVLVFVPSTRRGGTTITSGLPNPNHRFALPLSQIVGEERTVRGSYLGSGVPARDIPRYIDLYQRGRLPVDRLMGEVFTLDTLNEGFDRMATGSGLRDVVLMD